MSPFFFLFMIRHPYWNFSRLILGHIENFIESSGNMVVERDIFPADDFIVKCCLMWLIFSAGFIGCLDVLRAPEPSCSVGECRPLDLPHCGSLGFLRQRCVKARWRSRLQIWDKLRGGFAPAVASERKALISEFRHIWSGELPSSQTKHYLFSPSLIGQKVSIHFLYR